jgi:hypothetical protein
MTDRCSSSQCSGSSCQGCANGKVWCLDPRCYPKCEGCTSNLPNDIQPIDVGLPKVEGVDAEDILMFVVLSLVLILVIGIIIYIFFRRSR